MSNKAFISELQRAKGRKDTTALLCDLEDYWRNYRAICGFEKYEPTVSGSHERVMDAPKHDPDAGLAYLALAMANYDDPEFLSFLSAGLLEELLRDPSPEILNRIVAEARKTARCRWMLSGVLTHAIAERARPAIVELAGDWRLEDPLPAAPF